MDIQFKKNHDFPWSYLFVEKISINNNRRKTAVAERRRLWENYEQGMFETDISVLVRHVCTAQISRINVYLHAK